MAIPGTTTIAAMIAPNNERSSIAIQSEQWNKGGYRSVRTIEERDAILKTKRWAPGMLVNVLALDTIFKLVPKEGADYNSENVEDFEFRELVTAGGGQQIIQGEQGPVGPQGERGPQGLQGLSAYQIAVNNGFEGTQEEWLQSLRGPKGEKGEEQFISEELTQSIAAAVALTGRIGNLENVLNELLISLGKEAFLKPEVGEESGDNNEEETEQPTQEPEVVVPEVKYFDLRPLVSEDVYLGWAKDVAPSIYVNDGTLTIGNGGGLGAIKLLPNIIHFEGTTNGKNFVVLVAGEGDGGNGVFAEPLDGANFYTVKGEHDAEILTAEVEGYTPAESLESARLVIDIVDNTVTVKLGEQVIYEGDVSNGIGGSDLYVIPQIGFGASWSKYGLGNIVLSDCKVSGIVVETEPVVPGDEEEGEPAVDGENQTTNEEPKQSEGGSNEQEEVKDPAEGGDNSTATDGELEESPTKPEAPEEPEEEETAVSLESYWGVVPSTTPSASDIEALENKQTLTSLSGVELEMGDPDNDGYVAFACPADIANNLTFFNRENSFTVVPLKEIVVELNGAEYKVFVFEYNFEILPYTIK